MPRSESLRVYLPPRMKTAMERYAEDMSMSLSEAAKGLIARGLESQDYWPPAKRDGVVPD